MMNVRKIIGTVAVVLSLSNTQTNAVAGSAKSLGSCSGHTTADIVPCLLNGQKSFGSVDSDMQPLTAAQQSELQTKNFNIVQGTTGKFIYTKSTSESSTLALADAYSQSKDDNHYVMGILWGYDCNDTKQKFYKNNDAQYQADKNAAQDLLKKYNISDSCK